MPAMGIDLEWKHRSDRAIVNQTCKALSPAGRHTSRRRKPEISAEHSGAVAALRALHKAGARAVAVDTEQ